MKFSSFRVMLYLMVLISLTPMLRAEFVFEDVLIPRFLPTRGKILEVDIDSDEDRDLLYFVEKNGFGSPTHEIYLFEADDPTSDGTNLFGYKDSVFLSDVSLINVSSINLQYVGSFDYENDGFADLIFSDPDKLFLIENEAPDNQFTTGFPTSLIRASDLETTGISIKIEQAILISKEGDQFPDAIINVEEKLCLTSECESTNTENFIYYVSWTSKTEFEIVYQIDPEFDSVREIQPVNIDEDEEIEVLLKGNFTSYLYDRNLVDDSFTITDLDPESFTNGATPYLANLNGDNLTDILLIETYPEDQMICLINDPEQPGDFLYSEIIQLSDSLRYFHAEDFDHDGIDELAVGSDPDEEFQIHKIDFDNSVINTLYTRSLSLGIGLSTYFGFAKASDQHPPILIYVGTYGMQAINMGNDPNLPTDSQPFEIEIGLPRFVAGDVTHDGVVDIVIASGYTLVYEGVYEGDQYKLTTPFVLETPEMFGGTEYVHLTDFDTNNLLELTSVRNSGINIFQYDLNLTSYTLQTELARPPFGREIHVVDLDQDGKESIVMSAYLSKLQYDFYKNNSDQNISFSGPFSLIDDASLSFELSSFKDINLDGILDFVGTERVARCVEYRDAFPFPYCRRYVEEIVDSTHITPDLENLPLENYDNKDLKAADNVETISFSEISTAGSKSLIEELGLPEETDIQLIDVDGNGCLDLLALTPEDGLLFFKDNTAICPDAGRWLFY